MKRFTFIISLMVTTLMLAPSSSVMAGSIKKCKDANGQWHYGSSAARACGKSEIIEFKAGTNKKTVHKAPPTKDQLEGLKAKKIADADAKRQKIEQARQDKLLVASYAVEADIIYERDRKIKDLQDGIDSSEATLASLTAVRDRALKRAEEEKTNSEGVSKNTAKTLAGAERQVKRHTRAVQEKTRELEEMKRFYENALIRYRAMKQRRAGKTK